jgi:hypothetical protein
MSDTQPRIPVSGKLNPAGSLDAYADYDPRIRSARALASGAARENGTLDPLLAEVVRLRNAELQGCNY